MEHTNTETKNNSSGTALKVLLKLALTALAIVVIIFAGSLLALLLISGDVHMPIPYIVGYGLPALLLPAIWLNQKKKKYMKIWLIIAAVCLAVTAVDYGFAAYDESLRIVTSYSPCYGTDDPLVFIVHKDNPVDSLTTRQLQDIYSGKITNWAEVGGSDMEITAYQSDDDSESMAQMKVFMGGIPFMEAPTKWGYGYLYAWGNHLADFRNKPDSIGFCFASRLDEESNVKLLQVDGVAPTRENLENGTYPIATTVYAEETEYDDYDLPDEDLID